MNGHKKIIFLLSLCFIFQWLEARSNFPVADTAKKEVPEFSFYNGVGFGFAERSGIFSDHVFFGFGKFYLGGRARFSTRKYWRSIYYTPYSKTNEFKFVNEFALLSGYRILDKESVKIILTAGPLLRWEKAREWPDKGSGGAPLIGTMLQRRKSDDVIRYGLTASAEIGFMKPAKMSGISLFVFGSYTKDLFIGGVALNLLLGRF